MIAAIRMDNFMNYLATLFLKISPVSFMILSLERIRGKKANFLFPLPVMTDDLFFKNALSPSLATSSQLSPS